MQQRNRQPRPTSLGVREMRARIVLDEIRTHPELVERVEDIARIPRLARWRPEIRDAAVADLAADGRLTEAADGRLCVVKRRRGR